MITITEIGLARLDEHTIDACRQSLALAAQVHPQLRADWLWMFGDMPDGAGECSDASVALQAASATLPWWTWNVQQACSHAWRARDLIGSCSSAEMATVEWVSRIDLLASLAICECRCAVHTAAEEGVALDPRAEPSRDDLAQAGVRTA